MRENCTLFLMVAVIGPRSLHSNAIEDLWRRLLTYSKAAYILTDYMHTKLGSFSPGSRGRYEDPYCPHPELSLDLLGKAQWKCMVPHSSGAEETTRYGMGLSSRFSFAGKKSCSKWLVDILLYRPIQVHARCTIVPLIKSLPNTECRQFHGD